MHAEPETPTGRARAWFAGLLVLGIISLAATWWLGRGSDVPVRIAPPIDTRATIQRVMEDGVLRIATVRSPVTYFQIGQRQLGFERDLATAFANDLGVTTEFVVANSFGELFDLLREGSADLAAANITVTPERMREFAFAESYQEVTQQVVYKEGRRKPRNPGDLVDKRIAVISGSSYAETMTDLLIDYPGLTWTESSEDIETLLSQVVAGDLDYTIVDSAILDVHRRFFPRLARAFAVTDPQPVAWAFRQSDEQLLQRANEFFTDIPGQETIERLKDKHHAHLPGYDRTHTLYLLRHIRSRLPVLEPLFQAAAAEHQFDWRLLAAIAYQESHWDPQAISPTGVRGVMMLTRTTAREMGVENRLAADESIAAGTAYLRRMHGRIPDRIREPDRTWMALAAYNVGWGHLEDARILTQRAGMNPDRWADVAAHLPLLAQKAYYPTTRYGYARGREPVKYVANIRSYYDVITWHYLNRDDGDQVVLESTATPVSDDVTPLPSG